MGSSSSSSGSGRTTYMWHWKINLDHTYQCRRKHRHTKETIIYITAFRRAIYTAVALRILLLLAGIGYLGRRLPLSRLIKLY